MRIPRPPRLPPAALPLVLAALCACADGLGAQQTPSVLPGERVRVTAPDLPRRIGTVVAVRADTLVFRPRRAPAPVALAIPEVSRLEVARGRHSPLKGALIGAGLGTLAGYGTAAAMVAGRECDASDCIGGREFAAFSVWMGATAAGGIGGALVAADTERWVSVPLASLAPAGAVTRPAGLPQGALLRVSAPEVAAGPVVARLVGVRGDSLVLRTAGGDRAVPLAGVRAVEIGSGRTRTGSTLRGAAAGAGFLGVAIGAVGYAAARGEAGGGTSPAANALWMGGLFGAPLGAAVGGLAGYAAGAQRWVRLPPLTRVGVAPGREGGVALGLTVPAR